MSRIRRAADAGGERAARTAASWTASQLLATLLGPVVGPVVAGVAGTNLVTAVAYAFVVQAFTSGRRARGELDDRGYRIETVRNVGWGAGAFVGMMLGGIVGSIVPIVGTVVVSVVFGAVGGLCGAGVGRLVGHAVHGRRSRAPHAGDGPG